MSIQTALSVGDPVKNRDTSEVKEWVALNPAMMSTIPPTSSAREMSLFMFVFLSFVLRPLRGGCVSARAGNDALV